MSGKGEAIFRAAAAQTGSGEGSLGLSQTGARMPGNGQLLQVWNRSTIRAAELGV